MVSLIVIILSILLAGLLAFAVIYSINVSDRKAEASANSLLKYATQVYAARTLQYQDRGERSDALSVLVTDDYLDAIPIPPASAYLQYAGEPPVRW